MGNIASIHISKGHIGEFFHNDRSKDTVNSIFDKSRNEYTRSAEEALKMYREDIEEKSRIYTERTKQKLQKKAVTLLSAVVNIKEDTTLDDLKKLCNFLEEKLKTRVYQIAIHRDEGHVENEKEIINHHAHILMSGLDEEGRSVRRKLDKRMLRELQDITAETLNMERGRSVRETKRKRLDTYEYKEAMKLKNKEVLELKKKLIEKDNEIEELKVSKKELETQIKELRETMKNFNAEKGQEGKEKEFSQQDYKALGEIKRLLKAQNLSEAVKKLSSFESEIKQRIKQRQKALINKYSEKKSIFSSRDIIDKEIALKIANTVCKSENKNITHLLEKEKENEKLKEELQKKEIELFKKDEEIEKTKRFYEKYTVKLESEVQKLHKRLNRENDYSKANKYIEEMQREIKREVTIKRKETMRTL